MIRAIAGLLVACIVTIGCGRERKPTSSIPVTSKVSWWPYTKNLSVDKLNVTRINERGNALNLFNSKFDLSIQLSGLVRGQPGWRPYVSELHIAEVRDNPLSNDGPYVARLLITPVIGVVEDETYTDQTIRWSIRYVRHGRTMGWGVNRFFIQCLNVEKAIDIVQRK